MAGYWPISFFACLSVHKLPQKGRDQYAAILTKKAWAIKDLLQCTAVYGFRERFLAGYSR